MDRTDVLRRGKTVLEVEARAIGEVAEWLGESFVRAVDLIFEHCVAAGGGGKVICMGVGKSGLIAQKISSTFVSTGTPAQFLHPVEALHGNLGIIQKRDVVLMLSNSGEAQELFRVIPFFKEKGIPLILITGRMDSTLSRYADCVILGKVSKEACILGLAPTASTTAALALGDALAVALMEKSGFRREDYARFHPGGKLGERLKKISDLMVRGEHIPKVQESAPMGHVILEMSSKRLGFTAVLSEEGKLSGVITDGDLRRWLEKGGDLFRDRAKDVMTQKPKTIVGNVFAEDALRFMKACSITVLLVVEQNDPNELVGVVQVHSLISYVS